LAEALAVERGRGWKWSHYYWNLCKQVGSETYKTWRWELCSSVLVGLFVGLLNGNWADFRTALLATAMALGCFVVWHILRVPWLLHKSIQTAEGNNEPSMLAGIFGFAVIAALVVGTLALGRALWSARPLGTIEARMKTPPVSAMEQTRVVTVQGPCKLTSEQINPARLPQPCPGAPAPTLRDRVLAINTHLTEGDRNRFSDALSEFSDSLSQGETLAYKLNTELASLGRGESDGTIAKEVQGHEKILSDIAAEGWKYQKAFPALRTKWDMFRDQNEYIFGDNPDNEGPNAIINSAQMYRNYLEWWNVIPNKDQRPILNLLSVEHNESQGHLTTFFKWQRGCVSRLNEMRNSIR
jgi:hypothetical protein